MSNLEINKTDFDRFLLEVNAGVLGKNEGIVFENMPRASKCINIRRAMVYVLGGFTGSGKTSIVDEIFVLNPYDQLKRLGQQKKLRVIYWSMERRKNFKIAKWLARRIFLDMGIIIPMNKILGWIEKTGRLTKDEHDMVIGYKDYFDEMLGNHVTIIDGRRSPAQIRKFLKELALSKGREEQLDEFRKVYIPDDDDEIVLNIFDHAGKLMQPQGKSRKETIDDFSDDCSNIYRDLYGYSNVILSQFNREINNPMRLKAGDVEPRMEDFKDTSDMAEDADCVFSLFDPWRYDVPDPSGYDKEKLRASDGSKRYRNLKVLKNSFGPEDVRVGLAYQPETGIFREMPKLKKDALGRIIPLDDRIYNSILDNSYFKQ